MSHNTTPSHREITLIREEIGLIERYRVQTAANLQRLDNGQHALWRTDDVLEDLAATRRELKAVQDAAGI